MSKTEKYMQASPKKSSKGQTKTFLQILLAKTTAPQCPRRLLESRIQYAVSTGRLPQNKHWEHFSSLPGIQNLMNKKKDLLHTEFIQNSCTGMFITITNFEEYLS